jgi:hypothetical protein
MDAPRPQEHLMTGFRFFTVIVIFLSVSAAWLILGGTLEYRTATLERLPKVFSDSGHI